MHRFYLAPGQCHGELLSLTGREAHHALHVLRARPGERVAVLNGQGGLFECEIAQTSRDGLELKVLQGTTTAASAYQVTLIQAIPKGKLFEDIIEKATELGVHRIVPLLTKRTVGQFSEEDRARKLSKWRLTAIEAIKQSGSAWLPRIEMPLTVEESIAQLKTIDLQLLGSLAEGARHPKIYFEEFAAINARKPRSISVAVGPEGDFTPEELEAFQAAGGRPITLGRLVLRTDTAAVYCLSVINYQLSSP